MYLLDTNISISAMNGRHPRLREHLLSISPDRIFISSVTVGELVYGAAKSHWGERTRDMMHAFLANFTILPFTEDDAVFFGLFRAQLAASGTPIGAYDVMIAAQGAARNLTVITHNTDAFSRIPELRLEDWAE